MAEKVIAGKHAAATAVVFACFDAMFYHRWPPLTAGSDDDDADGSVILPILPLTTVHLLVAPVAFTQKLVRVAPLPDNSLPELFGVFRSMRVFRGGDLIRDTSGALTAASLPLPCEGASSPILVPQVRLCGPAVSPYGRNHIGVVDVSGTFHVVCPLTGEVIRRVSFPVANLLGAVASRPIPWLAMDDASLTTTTGADSWQSTTRLRPWDDNHMGLDVPRRHATRSYCGL